MEAARNLRVAYAILAFLFWAMLGLDFETIFVDEFPLIPIQEGRQTIDQDTWTILEFLPQTPLVYWTAFVLTLSHCVMMGLGFFPRLQAAFLFFWTTMFRHHNNAMWNSEDTVLRILVFLFIFFPPPTTKTATTSSNSSIGSLVTTPTKTTTTPTTTTTVVKDWPMWPFRLMQCEMCLIFMSTAIIKWNSEEWTSGIALWYVVHLDDLYGLFFNPDFIFGYHTPLKLLTWATLVLEAMVPIMVWFRWSRPLALFMVIGFHISLDLSMNLNFFHPLMILGWCSFFVQPCDDATKETMVSKEDEDNDDEVKTTSTTNQTKEKIS